MTDTQAPIDAAPGSPKAPKTRQAKPKHTYMLHDDKSFASLGKYVSTDYRYAALKVASRNITPKILLRRTNTKLVYVFDGKVVQLDKPQIVKRGERTIEYTKKPVVKFIRKYMYEGELPDDTDDAIEEKKPAKKRVKKNAEPAEEVPAPAE